MEDQFARSAVDKQKLANIRQSEKYPMPEDRRTAPRTFADASETERLDDEAADFELRSRIYWGQESDPLFRVAS